MEKWCIGQKTETPFSRELRGAPKEEEQILQKKKNMDIREERFLETEIRIYRSKGKSATPEKFIWAQLNQDILVWSHWLSKRKNH